MTTKELSKAELRELMKEAVVAALIERMDLLEEAVSEGLLKMYL